MRILKGLLLCGTFAIAGVCLANPELTPPSAAISIAVHHPVLAIASEQATTGSLSMELVNLGDHPFTVIGAVTPAAASAKLTQTGTEQARFVLNSITLKPKAHYQFSPNGTYFALNQLQPLKSGENVPLVIVFADGSHLDIQAKVMALA